MRQNQKGFANLVLIGIVGLLIIAGGYFVWKKNYAPVVQPVIAQPVVTTTSNDISTWKTYTNTQYGFQLEYPETWYVSEVPRDNSNDIMTVYFSNTKNYGDDAFIAVSVFDKTTFDDTEDTNLISGFSSEDNVHPVIIGAYTGKWLQSFKDEGTYIDANDSVEVETNNYGYKMWLVIPTADYRDGKNITFEKYFEQFISTFKFTN